MEPNHSGAKNLLPKGANRGGGVGTGTLPPILASVPPTLIVKGLVWKPMAKSFTTASPRHYPKPDGGHKFFIKLYGYPMTQWDTTEITEHL